MLFRVSSESFQPLYNSSESILSLSPKQAPHSCPLEIESRRLEICGGASRPLGALGGWGACGGASEHGSRPLEEASSLEGGGSMGLCPLEVG